MLSKPSNWDTVYNANNYDLQLRFRVSLIENVSTSDFLFDIFNENIEMNSCIVEHSAFDDLSIGNTCAASMSIKLVDLGANAYVIRHGMTCILRARLKDRTTGRLTGWFTVFDGIVDEARVDSEMAVTIKAFDCLQFLGNISCGNSSTGTLGGITTNVISYYLHSAMYDPNPFLNSTRINGSSTNRYFSVPATMKDASVRDLYSSAAALSGSNLTARRSTLSIEYIDIGNQAYITDEPLGIVTTVESLTHNDEMPMISAVRLRTGSQFYDSNTGWCVAGNVNSLLSPTTEKAVHAYNSLAASTAPSLRFSDVMAKGAEVNPLFELGDIISVPLPDGTYYNFRVLGYRVTFCGRVFGDLWAKRTGEAIVDNVGTREDTTWYTLHLRTPMTTLPGSNFVNDYMVKVPEKIICNRSDSNTYGRTPGQDVVRVAKWPTAPITLTFTYYNTSNTQKSVTLTTYPVYRYLPVDITSDGTHFCITGQMYYMRKPADYKSSIGFSSVSGATNEIDVNLN